MKILCKIVLAILLSGFAVAEPTCSRVSNTQFRENCYLSQRSSFRSRADQRYTAAPSNNGVMLLVVDERGRGKYRILDQGQTWKHRLHLKDRDGNPRLLVQERNGLYREMSAQEAAAYRRLTPGQRTRRPPTKTLERLLLERQAITDTANRDAGWWGGGELYQDFPGEYGYYQEGLPGLHRRPNTRRHKLAPFYDTSSER